MKALSVVNGPALLYHFDFRAATSIAQNQQTFAYTGGPREMTANTNLYNWATTQIGSSVVTSGGALNPALLNIKWNQVIECYNTGASILYVKWNKWVCREDINTIAGQTDTIANIIAHGLALVAPTALAGTGPFSQTTVGYSLFRNPYWCRHFKAVKTYHFTLLPGERKSFRMRDNYVFNQKETEPSGSAPVSFVKGFALIGGYMYGQPSFDAAAGATPTNIGTAGGGMIAYSTVDCKLWAQMIGGNKQYAAQTTTFNQATAGNVWQSVASADTTVTRF